jgi:hypothetical protein
MTDENPEYTFDPKEELPIPVWPLPSPPPSQEERLYIIGMQAENGRLRFVFVERPAHPDPSVDGPLEIRVPQDCTIILRLDDSWNWQFRHANAVMLGPMNYADRPRYFNLTPTIVNGRCMEIRFSALRLSGIGDLPNQDRYALYLNIDQDMPANAVPLPLLVRIDPDIDNPGDRPHG